MTATYSGDPSVSPRDAVRFLIRDTNTSDALIQDEEIDWLLSEAANNIYSAAIQAAESVVASYSVQGSSGQTKTKSVGALSISRTASYEVAKEYRAIVGDLKRRQALNTTIRPYAGGISASDKQINAQDDDWDKPAFTRKMHDFPHSEVWREELTDWPST